MISKNKEEKRGNIWKPSVRSHMTARDHRGEIPTTLEVLLNTLPLTTIYSLLIFTYTLLSTTSNLIRISLREV